MNTPFLYGKGRFQFVVCLIRLSSQFTRLLSSFVRDDHIVCNPIDLSAEIRYYKPFFDNTSLLDEVSPPPLESCGGQAF